MRPEPHDASAREHQDLGRIADGPQPVRHDDDDPAGGEAVEGTLHLALGVGVEAGGRLVQQQEGRVLQERARAMLIRCASPRESGRPPWPTTVP